MSEESEHQHSLEDRARALIKATGGRVTIPRWQTLALLLDSGQALSHGDIRKNLPNLDRVSLYRSLEWLQKHGLVFRIDTAGLKRYGASHQEDGHHHPHFHCVSCGLTCCLSEQSDPSVQLPPGFKLQKLEIVAIGLCQKCLSENE